VKKLLFNFLSFPPVCPSKSCFSKEKTEKKKAQEVCPEKKPEGNGIIGGDPSGEAAVYAVVFWQPVRR